MSNHATALRRAFEQCGWTPERLPAIASKTFETACTPKMAFVYLYPDGTLWGHYQSEGRNALAAHFWNVDASNPTQLQERIARIDHEVSRAVDATYARSLWLNGVRPCHVIAETASAS